MAKKQRVVAPADTFELGDLKPEEGVILRGILAGVETLYRKHATEIEQVRADDEKKSVKIGFAVAVDASEGGPSLKVGIRFSATVTDNIVSILPDPDQPEFTFISPDELRAQRAEEGGDGE